MSCLARAFRVPLAKHFSFYALAEIFPMPSFDQKKAKLMLRLRRQSAELLNGVNLILNALGFMDPDMVDLEFIDAHLAFLNRDCKVATDLIANYYASLPEVKK